jgi:hypothetical protein
MNWKIILRNGFIGGIIIIFLSIALPVTGFYTAKILNSLFIGWLVMALFIFMIPVLITLSIIDLIPQLPGYSSDSIKKWKIILTEIISMILFMLFIFIALKSNYIQQKIGSL